jgi:hypothetical protein
MSGPLGALDLRSRMIALEVLTEDPRHARFAVMQLDGHVRLVAENPYFREADITHARGTPGFEQFVRYWRIERSEDAVRQASGGYTVDADGVRHMIAGANDSHRQ